MPCAHFYGENLCKFVVDLGLTGANGKTVLMMIFETLLGEYADQAAESVLTKPPPAANQPAPDVLAWRGLRVLATPEFETTQQLRSGWVKAFVDKGKQWKARDLYASDLVKFALQATFYISVNEKLKFTVLDGGLDRRALCFDYKLKFVSHVTKPHERQARSESETKNPKWITEQLPGFMLLLLACHKAFFAGENPVGLGATPQQVIEATEELVNDEAKTALEGWIGDNFSKSTNAQGAISKAAFISAARSDCEAVKELKNDAVMKAINSLVEFKDCRAGRGKTRLRGCASWLKPNVSGLGEVKLKVTGLGEGGFN